jgi:hypothetical protein
MVVVVYGDDDAEEARQFGPGSEGLHQPRLRQRLHIDLAGEQAGEEQVAGAAEAVCRQRERSAL